MTTAPGNLFVVSAPSGAGKTSLVRALIASDPDLRLSVSHTTRPMRAGEVNGDHYHFVSAGEFERMCCEDAFLEQATVFDHRYGTARAQIAGHLIRGRDVILEIDWQGARQVRARSPGCVGIFVLPPSIEQLESRLRKRAQDDAGVIARRMHAAVNEVSHYDEFDYLVVNDDFDTAVAQLRSIIVAQRLRRTPQSVRHAALMESLLAGMTET